MARIEFVQFLRPNGHRVVVAFETEDQALADLAQKVRSAGGRFEVEELRTGQVSFEVVRDGEDEDEVETVASEICTNGPPVVKAVARLVRNAAESMGVG